MSQDEVNDQFRTMMFTEAVEETDDVIRQIISCEAEARHAMACEDDRQAAADFANAGYQILLSAPMRMVPSVVMGLADMFNREHEAYTLQLDYLSDIKEHIRQFRVLWERGDTAIALANIGAIESIIAQADASAIYEKTDDPQ